MVNKNEIFTATAVDYTEDGMAIVKKDGFCTFVKCMIRDEEADIHVLSSKKHYAYGKVEKMLKPSTNRRDPVCPLYPKCGGCQILHMTKEEQAYFKQKKVENVMQRIAKVDIPVSSILSAENEYYYRNKVQIPVQEKDGVLVGGFYRINSHDIIPLEKCYLQSDLGNAAWNHAFDLIKKYNYGTLVRHVLIKHAFATDQLMVVLIVRDFRLKKIDEFAKELKERLPELQTLVLNLNTRDDNVILGDKEKVIYGDGTIIDELMGLKFRISAHSFYQVNPAQTKVLYQTAINFAELNENDIVADVYGGIGTIGLIASRHCKKVLGIEIVPEAVKDANQNARLNGITNAEYIASDARSAVGLWEKQHVKIDVAFIDPPRKGCDNETINSLVELKPRRIVYVSCDPATLARDLVIFQEKGYKVCKIQPVDMFPNSSHCETIALLVRK